MASMLRHPSRPSKEPFPNTDPRLRHPSDDGTHIVKEGKEELFAKWFHENGGSYPKIDWPSRTTMGQVRGTIAKEDISTNEPMLFVPENIMISPPICHANPLIGHVFTENPHFFARDDDTMLAVFVMFEKERGEESFWHPYLAMLPWPCSVADWSNSELDELQDRILSQQATMRPIKLREKYETLMNLLLPKYEDLFSREVHTLEKYVFAWMTIQARAFGRRIPWTALVPFADCLNHTNVQTKYDFNATESSKGIFRLFPTGENKYSKGSEVFNSYGRRDNRFLLMEYGFVSIILSFDGV
jgi:histone-lysine N-methyltransferase SETD3